MKKTTKLSPDQSELLRLVFSWVFCNNDAFIESIYIDEEKREQDFDRDLLSLYRTLVGKDLFDHAD